MKNDYFENDDKKRKKRKSKKKGKSAAKAVLVVISLIVVAVAAFVITVKVLNPDYDFGVLIPESVMSAVNTNEETSSKAPETTAKPTTTKKMLDYIEAENFKLDTKKEGNFIGNLLNGGKVATDYTYVYHIVDGKGIYRFNPYSESYALTYKTSDTLSSLNLRGDYCYFVNETDGALYKMQKGTSKPKKIAEDAVFVYVYDTSVYYITSNNQLCLMDAKALEPTVLYYSADDEMKFVGISLDRVFFAVKDINGNTEYLTVENNGGILDGAEFRESTADGEIECLEIENGFIYYYARQADGTYNLERKKYGSQKTVTLFENVDKNRYAEVDSNRVFFSTLSDEKYKMKELNMNSNKDKTLLTVKSVKEDNTLSFFHGGEYDFIIGKKSEDGDKVYSSSCIYTSSTNVMKFKDGRWKY